VPVDRSTYLLLAGSQGAGVGSRSRRLLGGRRGAASQPWPLNGLLLLLFFVSALQAIGQVWRGSGAGGYEASMRVGALADRRCRRLAAGPFWAYHAGGERGTRAIIEAGWRSARVVSLLRKGKKSQGCCVGCWW
jgi:hypothetical protein